MCVLLIPVSTACSWPQAWAAVGEHRPGSGLTEARRGSQQGAYRARFKGRLRVRGLTCRWSAVAKTSALGPGPWEGVYGL